MDARIFSEYRFKFYLNASHSIMIDGNQGQVHPHTWEMTIDIIVPRENFTQFNVYEKEVSKFFEQYQNSTLNDMHPFDAVIPTLEIIVEYFGVELRRILTSMGCELLRIEGSETPTRSYIVAYSKTSDFLESIDRQSKAALDRLIDSMIDDVLA